MKNILWLLLSLCVLFCNAKASKNGLPLIHGADSMNIYYRNVVNIYHCIQNFEIHIDPNNYYIRDLECEGSLDSLLTPLICLADSMFAQKSVAIYSQKERNNEDFFFDGDILRVSVFRKGHVKTSILPLMNIYSHAPAQTEDGYIVTYSRQYRLFVQMLDFVIAKLSGIESFAEYWNDILKYKYDDTDMLVLFPDTIPVYGKGKDYMLCEKIIEKALSTFGTFPYIYKYAYELGKDLVPALIDHIDDSDNGRVWFSDFLDYYDQPSPRYLLGNRVGIRYAHLIDFLLSTDSLSMKQRCCRETTSEWENPCRFFKVYDKCVIFRKDSLGNPSEKVLDLDDMKQIKEIYQKWWNENKNQALEAIKKQWNKKCGLLEHTDYRWR